MKHHNDAPPDHSIKDDMNDVSTHPSKISTYHRYPRATMTQAVTLPSGHVIINTFGDLSDTSTSLQSTVHAVETAGNGPEARLHCRTFSNQARQFK